MIQTNWFGRGFRLRMAITIACQLAFVLFGYDQVGSNEYGWYMRGPPSRSTAESSDNRVSFQALLEMQTGLINSATL